MIVSRGSLYMLLAIFVFSLVNFGIKALDRIPILQIILFRALASIIFSSIALRIQKKSLIGNNKKLLILRGITGTIGLTLFFYTLQQLPLATAVVLQYLSPIFTILLAGFIVKEPARPVQWAFFLIAFVGVIFLKGFDTSISIMLLSLGLISALFSGVSYNLVRKLRATDDANTVVLYFSLVTLPCILPFLFEYWTEPTLIEWISLIAIGTGIHIAQILMTLAFHLERAEKVSAITYLGVILAAIYGYFFFDEKISIIGAIGMLLIMGSVIASNWVRSLRKQTIS